MSREIKFRAWDDARNEWYGESDDQRLTFVAFHIFGECTMLCPPSLADLEHLIIEQFTGLLDKNGQEIFEGDIGRTDIDDILYQVTWNEQRFCFDIKGDPKGFLHTCAMSTAPQVARILEIIGNIHENPELLK